MRGYRVPRKAGWDTHGLPVELEVERRLGIDGKGQIEAYGVAEFNKLCRESVTTYLEEWERFTERIGFWVDLDDAYYTYTNEYIESVWWLLRQIWDKDLLYQGFKVVPYCPRCGTAISSHEVAQGYKDVTEDSIYVRFPLTAESAARVAGESAGEAGGELKPVSLAVWTTTPWTLISNVAAAVHPDVDLRARREPRANASSSPATSWRRSSARRPRCCASSPAPSCWAWTTRRSSAS